MSTYQVEQVELEQQQTAVVRDRARVEEFPSFLGGAFGEVVRVLAAQELAPAGPPFGRYTPAGDGFDVEAGFPTAGEVGARGRVVASAAGPPQECCTRATTQPSPPRTTQHPNGRPPTGTS